MFCFLYKRPKQHQQSRHKYKHAQKRVKYSLDKTYAHVRAYLELHNDSLKIYISLPEAQVLDNYVIWDTVRCQEENNILNPIDFEQYQGIISEIEAEGLALAEADGIYEDAEANMETIICNFLSSFEDYEIVFL